MSWQKMGHPIRAVNWVSAMPTRGDFAPLLYPPACGWRVAALTLQHGLTCWRLSCLLEAICTSSRSGNFLPTDVTFLDKNSTASLAEYRRAIGEGAKEREWEMERRGECRAFALWSHLGLTSCFLILAPLLLLIGLTCRRKSQDWFEWVWEEFSINTIDNLLLCGPVVHSHYCISLRMDDVDLW